VRPVTEGHALPETTILHLRGEERTEKRSGGGCLSRELKCEDRKVWTMRLVRSGEAIGRKCEVEIAAIGSKRVGDISLTDL